VFSSITSTLAAAGARVLLPALAAGPVSALPAVLLLTACALNQLDKD
jgi:hypothetical protein